MRVAILPAAPITSQPWIDLKIIIRSGVYFSQPGIIKHVRPDGRGSLRLGVFVPPVDRTVELDVFAVAEELYVARRFFFQCFQILDRSGKLLFDYQPLQPHQQAFKILPELKAMRTGPVPWVGLKVDIVRGHFKGQRGIIRDVNRYQYNAQKPMQNSCISLMLERMVIGPSSGNLNSLDYNDVRYQGINGCVFIFCSQMFVNDSYSSF